MGQLSGIEGKGAKVGSKNTRQMGRRNFHSTTESNQKINN